MMVEQVIPTEQEEIGGRVIHLPSGKIIATNVSAEEYMEKYAADFCEWVNGTVIKMSPVRLIHDQLSEYLRNLLAAYFSLNAIGQVIGAPFMMRLDDIKSRREPDLQIVLNTNPGELTDTAMIGPADICIEIVSPDSETRDYGEKLGEYEKGGVGEYWIIDPIRKETVFRRLTQVDEDKRVYKVQALDEGEIYRTPLLPKFTLHVPTLWQDDLPDYFAVGEAVKQMVAE